MRRNPNPTPVSETNEPATKATATAPLDKPVSKSQSKRCLFVWNGHQFAGSLTKAGQSDDVLIEVSAQSLNGHEWRIAKEDDFKLSAESGARFESGKVIHVEQDKDGNTKVTFRSDP